MLLAEHSITVEKYFKSPANNLVQEGDDVVLCHCDLPALYPKVRILNFMQNSSYRHIKLRDENGTLGVLTFNDIGAVAGCGER